MLNKKVLVQLALILSLVANAGLVIYLLNHHGPAPRDELKESMERYPYLSPRAHINSKQDFIINFTGLRTVIRDYIAQSPSKISFYFEYLPTGSSVSVNPEMEVKLASLIKVPVVMAAYKQIEQGKLSKDTIITLQPEHIDDRYGTLWQQGAGSRISVGHAMELALQESDNTAAQAINSLLPQNALEEVFDQFDLPKEIEDNTPILSPKGYSSILRNLYLATYLNKESSNEIIGMLTKSTATNLIAAGAPESVQVAHKMGVIETPADRSDVQSDCGIFYVQNRPYILCIMTEENVETATKDMAVLSKIVYDFVSKQ